jgi:hypothetical protein
MDRNFKISSDKLLAVEGKDECTFFDEFLKYSGITNVQTVDIGGKDKFKNELPLLIKMDGFSDITAIGFVRDAEADSAQSAFKSMCSIIKKCSLPIPKGMNTINQSNNPKTGIFIMPNNQNTGMLENLCLESLRGKTINDCINNYVNCFMKGMEDSEKNYFNKPKSKVQAYLASRVPVVSSLGLAAKKGYWNFQHPCFTDIANFLSDLFVSVKNNRHL